MKHPETHNKRIDSAIFFASFLGISSMGYRLDILQVNPMESPLIVFFQVVQ